MDSFKSEFLKNYLGAGIGSMGKKDVDALVMYLLDKYGLDDEMPLKRLSNQQVSIKLRATASRIKGLRYEAALKFAGDTDTIGKLKLLEVLAISTFDPAAGKICFLIEDVFTKNWLQGILKENGLIFDNSFNSEIVKIDIDPLCEVLSKIYDENSVSALKKRMKEAEKKKNKINFPELKKEFLMGAASAIGEVTTSPFTSGLLAMVACYK